jgi:uncharacterized protein YicC (UPF0701 family)
VLAQRLELLEEISRLQSSLNVQGEWFITLQLPNIRGKKREFNLHFSYHMCCKSCFGNNILYYYNSLKYNRVNYVLAQRLELLEEISRLQSSLNVQGDMSYTCETAGYFYLYQVSFI